MSCTLESDELPLVLLEVDDEEALEELEVSAVLEVVDVGLESAETLSELLVELVGVALVAADVKVLCCVATDAGVVLEVLSPLVLLESESTVVLEVLESVLLLVVLPSVGVVAWVSGSFALELEPPPPEPPPDEPPPPEPPEAPPASLEPNENKELHEEPLEVAVKLGS